MSHTDRDWMSKSVVVVDPDSSVSYAMTLMRRRNIHSVVIGITAGNPAYGIVTTTDIRDKIVAADRNPVEITVSEIMSGPLILAKAEWTLKECSQNMQKHNIHHLPVADDHGTLWGSFLLRIFLSLWKMVVGARGRNKAVISMLNIMPGYFHCRFLKPAT